MIEFRDELHDQLLARRAQHLAECHFPRALPRPRRRQVGEVHDRHAKDQQRDDCKGRNGRPVVAGSHAGFLGLAEMNVGNVDEVPIEIFSGIVADVPGNLVGNVPLLPCRLLRRHLRDFGTGPKLEENKAVEMVPNR